MHRVANQLDKMTYRGCALQINTSSKLTWRLECTAVPYLNVLTSLRVSVRIKDQLAEEQDKKRSSDFQKQNIMIKGEKMNKELVLISCVKVFQNFIALKITRLSYNEIDTFWLSETKKRRQLYKLQNAYDKCTRVLD